MISKNLFSKTFETDNLSQKFGAIIMVSAPYFKPCMIPAFFPGLSPFMLNFDPWNGRGYYEPTHSIGLHSQKGQRSITNYMYIIIEGSNMAQKNREAMLIDINIVR